MKHSSKTQRGYLWAGLLITSLAVTGLAGLLFYESLTDAPDPWADITLWVDAHIVNMTFVACHLTADFLPAFGVINTSLTVSNASTASLHGALAWDPDDVLGLTLTKLIIYSTTGRYRFSPPTTAPALPYHYRAPSNQSWWTGWWVDFTVTITRY